MTTEMISLPTIKQRECSSCSACCRVLAVPEIYDGAGKGNHCNCPHQELTITGPVSLQGACKIYPERPETCRSFVCRWLVDPELIPGDERRRPDNLGLMFAVTEITQTGAQVLTAWELWDGAAVEQQYFLDKLAKKHKLLIVTTPPERVAMFYPERLLLPFEFREDRWLATKTPMTIL